MPGSTEHTVDLGHTQRQAMNPEFVRHQVDDALNARFEVIERAYQNDEAALAEVLADTRLPEPVKAPLRDGGLRARIHDQLQARADAVEQELRSGEVGRDRLLQDPSLAASVKEQLANVPPRALRDPEVASTVVRLFRDSIMAKENAMVASATTAALEQLRKAMTVYGDQLVKQIEEGTKEAFATSITHMLGRAVWIVIAGVLLILLIPEIPMRSIQTKAPVPAEG
jgi:hypothetical protein